jgi:pyruvate formate lyase activating enzyme
MLKVHVVLLQLNNHCLGKEAELFLKLPNGRIKCTACARYCEIPEGKDGLCGIRGVANGRLQLYAYGRIIAGHIDPIEKKPVTHYMPGSSIYSIATTGCNWLCKYCQNYDISQRRKIEGTEMTPKLIVNTAINHEVHGIAYTYNEPSIFIEFAKDCGIEAHKKGLFNIFVSNGYDTPQSIDMMSKFLDCITVDFKGSGEEKFVRQYIGIPNSKPVFESIKQIKETTNIHIEITDLIVPQVGDNLEAARKLCKFIYNELGPDTPIHFLRFHPDYKMMEFESTPIDILEKHYVIAKEEGLRFAYLGNVPGHSLENTYCPECNNIVVKRYGFNILSWNLDSDNCCNQCKYAIPIKGKPVESLNNSTNKRKRYFQFIDF